MKQMIKTAMVLVLSALLLCTGTIFVGAADADTVVAEQLDDAQRYTNTEDTMMNWMVASGINPACEITLNTEGKLRDTNSIALDYNTSGVGYATFIFYPDDMEVNYGEGIMFTACAETPVRMRLVLNINYTYKQYFVDLGTEPRDYVIRYEDFTRIPGAQYWDISEGGDFVDFDICIVDDKQVDSGYKSASTIYVDDFVFFIGNSETTPSGVAMAQNAPGATTTAATTTTTDGNSPEGTTGDAQAGTTSNQQSGGTVNEGSLTWLYVTIGAVVVIAGVLAIVLIFVKKSKKV